MVHQAQDSLPVRASPHERLIIRTARFRADFLLPQFNAYVEYWGLAYPERSYAQKMNSGALELS